MNQPRHCWYDLTINIKNCFLDGYKLPTPSGQFGVWHPLARDVFNNEWLEYVTSLGLPIYSVMIFYRGPLASTIGAHVDISVPDPLLLTNFAINWVYGGKDSTMSWYETPSDNQQIAYTAANTPYKAWRRRELKKIESHSIGETVKLVRTGIPHSIEMGLDPRWCISARTSIHHDFEWEKVVDIMRKRNLLIERDV